MLLLVQVIHFIIKRPPRGQFVLKHTMFNIHGYIYLHFRILYIFCTIREMKFLIILTNLHKSFLKQNYKFLKQTFPTGDKNQTTYFTRSFYISTETTSNQNICLQTNQMTYITIQKALSYYHYCLCNPKSNGFCLYLN